VSRKPFENEERTRTSIVEILRHGNAQLPTVGRKLGVAQLNELMYSDAKHLNTG
jgi:hypothetical protein